MQQIIETLDPDIVALTEYGDMHDGIVGDFLRTKYRHQSRKKFGEDSALNLVVSKFPLQFSLEEQER